MWAGRIGSYFLTPTAGPRLGEVVYFRAGSAFAGQGEYDLAVLSEPGDLQQAVEGGMALAALKHFEPGDFCRADRAEWLSAMRGAGDVVR